MKRSSGTLQSRQSRKPFLKLHVGNLTTNRVITLLLMNEAYHYWINYLPCHVKHRGKVLALHNPCRVPPIKEGPVTLSIFNPDSLVLIGTPLHLGLCPASLGLAKNPEGEQNEYRSIGTCNNAIDASKGKYCFLHTMQLDDTITQEELNAILQVELDQQPSPPRIVTRHRHPSQASAPAANRHYTTYPTLLARAAAKAKTETESERLLSRKRKLEEEKQKIAALEREFKEQEAIENQLKQRLERLEYEGKIDAMAKQKHAKAAAINLAAARKEASTYVTAGKEKKSSKGKDHVMSLNLNLKLN